MVGFGAYVAQHLGQLANTTRSGSTSRRRSTERMSSGMLFKISCCAVERPEDGFELMVNAPKIATLNADKIKLVSGIDTAANVCSMDATRRIARRKGCVVSLCLNHRSEQA